MINDKPFYVNYEDEMIDLLNTDIEIIEYSDGQERVLIYFPGVLTAFKIYSVTYEAENDSFHIKDEIFALDRLTSGQALLYSTTVPCGMPISAISFTDEDGNIHTYLLYEKGNTGGVGLLKYDMVK